jgi:diguanylate cyclase (GGDEF)-like protein
LVIAEAAISEDIENLCQVVRSTEWGKPIFIAVIADTSRTQSNAILFSAGADAVIDPAISDADFQARLTPAHRLADLKALWQADRHDLRHTANELAISRRKFETLSLTDQLTELPNRRAGMKTLEQAWGRQERDGSSVGLLMLDIDHFKQVNDRYGHAAGDQVLVEAAKAWSAVTRTGDLLCRSGGEEFLVITNSTDVDGMVHLAARLQAATQAISIPWNGHTIRITASFGLALSDDSSDLEGLLNTADKTLYIAKSKGRNRLCYRDGGQYRLTTPSG